MDDDGDFMDDDNDPQYQLEYSDESGSEPDVDLENQYYNSKALKSDDPEAALESFQRVLDLEQVALCFLFFFSLEAGIVELEISVT